MWLLLFLLLPQIAWADALVCNAGLLTPAAQTATGASVNTVSARNATALAFQAKGTGTATITVEICCMPTCTTAGDWATVDNSSMSLAGGVSVAKSVLSPTCSYRTNVTACTGCSVTVAYSCATS